MDRLFRSSSLTLVGVAALALGCTGSDLLLPNQGLPAKVVVFEGDGQTASVGSVLPESIVVRVTDSQNRPIQQQQVTFAPSAGTVVPTAATTDADGKAGALWALGPTAGSQSVTATATGNGAPAGLAVTFHATATTSGAAKLDKSAGDGQSATAGSAVPTPPAVKLSDKGGNPVAGVAVTFAVASGGGAVNPTTRVTTNASGIAVATAWTLGPTAGPNTLTATVGLPGIAGNPATFTATGTVGSAGKLSVVQQPSAVAQSGVVFAQQSKVQVQDAGGNPVKSAGLAVTATIASGAGATLSGQLTVGTDANGIASFGNLALTGVLGAYTLGFTSPTLSGAASAVITLVAGTPTLLVIVQQPAAVGQSGVPLTQQPAVQLEDAQANPVAQAGVLVTAAINEGGGTLGGTQTVPTDAAGKATFTNLSIAGPNGQYTLVFTCAAPSLASIPSGPVVLAAGAPAALFLATAPSASVPNGQVFPQQPAIQVQDGAGNPAAAPGITITVAITGGGGTLSGSTTAVTSAAGLATFIGLSLTGAIGPHQLTFTSTTPPLTFTTASVTLTAGGATQIARHSVSPQSASVGAAVAAPPSVLVRDASLNPVAGVAVTFAVTAGGGSIVPTTPILTDATGVATLTRWTLGPAPGANTVTATAPGLAGSPVTFNATGVGVLTITATTPLPQAEVGTPYSTLIGIAGGSAPYTWALSPGPLPAILGLNTATGLISGTPTAATPAQGAGFSIKVTDVTGANTTKAFTLQVLPTVTIATAALPNGTVGVPYSQTLTAANGLAPYTWTVSAGAPPAGLVLNAATATLAGTPTVAGPFSFTIKVTDVLTGTATRAYVGTIASAPSVTTASLPNGELGVPYSTTLVGTGGTPPYTWSLALGTLPSGLGISSAGTISGMPTAPAGTSSFTVQLTDAGTATASKGLSIVVQPAVAIATTSLPNGAVGVAYSQVLTATGGQAPFTWRLASGALPTGVGISAAGVLSGSPTVAGPFAFTLRVTDALGGTATQAYAVTIAAAPTITSTSPLQAGEAGAPYLGATLAAIGGQPPYAFSVQSGSLDGLNLNASTGAITGTPTASGNFAVTFRVTDANTASSTKALTIPVLAAVTITTASPLPGGSVGSVYSQALAVSGGQAGFTWGLAGGAFPPGLGISAGGVVNGTPTVGGVFNGIVVQVTDALGGTDTQTYSITIAGAASSTSVTSSDQTAVFGEAVTFAATVSSGSGTPTGTVTFRDAGSCGSGTVLDTESLVGGTATSTAIPTLSVSGSPHTIFACYGGSNSFAASSGSLSQTVGPAATSVGVTSSANPSVFGQSVTFTAAVSANAPGSGTPGGTVRFRADGSNLGQNVALSGGLATRTTAGLAVGNHTITANYNGSANFQSSTGSLSSGQTVNQGTTTTAITSDLSAPTTSGQSITVSYDVSPVAPASGDLSTGGASVTVNLDAGGGGGSCTGSVTAGGLGSCTIAAPIGVGTPRTVTATYAGNANFTGSTSDPVSHEVDP
jgi:hypothetical protein